MLVKYVPLWTDQHNKLDPLKQNQQGSQLEGFECRPLNCRAGCLPFHACAGALVASRTALRPVGFPLASRRHEMIRFPVRMYDGSYVSVAATARRLLSFELVCYSLGTIYT